MATVKGKVFKVYDKNWGNRTTFSVKLEDNPIYYRMGSERHAGIAEPGNLIEFDAEPIDEKSANLKGKPRIVAATAAAPTASGAGTFSSARDSSIQYQSARKDALAFLDLIVRTEAVKLPSAATKKLAALEALLDRYTAGFFEDIATLGAVTRANGEGEAEAGGEPEGDDEE